MWHRRHKDRAVRWRLLALSFFCWVALAQSELGLRGSQGESFSPQDRMTGELFHLQGVILSSNTANRTEAEKKHFYILPKSVYIQGTSRPLPFLLPVISQVTSPPCIRKYHATLRNAWGACPSTMSSFITARANLAYHGHYMECTTSTTGTQQRRPSHRMYSESGGRFRFYRTVNYAPAPDPYILSTTSHSKRCVLVMLRCCSYPPHWSWSRQIDITEPSPSISIKNLPSASLQWRNWWWYTLSKYMSPWSTKWESFFNLSPISIARLLG